VDDECLDGTGTWEGSLIFLLIAVLMALWLWNVNREGKFAFPTILLEMIQDVLKQNGAMLAIATGLAVVQVKTTCRRRRRRSKWPNLIPAR